ncbi:MAG: hypothetical protein K8T90_19040 [Planctomycetes bacterium]|nr:hypothetical protein [Planctomycetota bacterium]
MTRTHGRLARFLSLATMATLLLAAPTTRTATPQDDDAVEIRTVFDIMGDFEKQKLLWRKEWMTEDADRKTDAAEIALKVATEKGLDRKLLKRQFDTASKERRATGVKNLDVGRHQLTKWILAEAYKETNARLKADGLTPLERTTTVNSGGTGDFTRDVDVTVFAGDEVRERTFFEAIRDIARKQGLTVETGADDSVKSGINIPEIEVAFHRGNNDLPDPRYTTDVQRFALDYRKAIEGQSRNPEAYFGYGFEMEVQGRRYLSFKPGQTLLQTFEMEGGKLKYRAQVASCNKEVRAVIRGAVGQRYRRAQNCVHAVNDYLQAYRHELHTGGDPTKGALKYAGRAIESLCEYHGFKNWAELRIEDRVQLLARIFPPGYLDTPGARRRLEYMSEGVDYAYAVFQGKSAPKSFAGKPMRPEGTATLALLFLRKASASMVGAVAQEMLDPPDLSARFLAEVNQHDSKWQEMSPDEREAHAKQRCENYKQCVSIAAMENLLATVEQLHVLDLPEFDPKGQKAGTNAIKEMLNGADPKLKPILQIAIDHAAASVRLQNAKTADERARASADLAAARTRMEEHTRKPSPGRQIEDAAAAVGAADYVKRKKAGGAVAGTDPPDETRKRMQKFAEDALYEDEAVGIRAEIGKLGVKGYVKKRMAEEVFQLGNVVDALQLIEMYQGGASAADYTWFATTNVLSRCYWGIGFAIQAVQVKNEEDLKALGKNVVFDAFSRVIPGMAQARIIFDIERGLVMVTFGHMINVVNADLIDALYTGEAGRVNAGTAGKVAGQIRDTGVCVLDGKWVIQAPDKKGVLQVVVDQPALYQGLFAEWFGPQVRFDEINTRSPLGGDKGTLLAAHDRLAKAILAMGTDKESSWFGKPTNYVDPNNVNTAAEAFAAAIAPHCRKKTDAVLDELAPRQYFSNGKDMIAEGLHQRLMSDVVGGMVATWQTQRVEQMFARREVDYAAKVGDISALGKALADAADVEMPKFDVELIGLDPKKTNWAPGSMPVSCRLRYDRPLPASLGHVKVDVETLPFIVVTEATPNDVTRVVKQPVIFRMTANDGAGPVVGERRVEFTVSVLPSAEQIIRKANTFSFRVGGKGKSVRVGGWQPGEVATTPSVEIAWSRHEPAAGVQWSGNAFTVDVKSSKGSGTPDSPLITRSVKAKGTYDPVMGIVSFEADSVDSESTAEEDYRNSKVETKHLSAVDVPVDQVWGASMIPIGADENWDPYVNGYTRTHDSRAVKRHRIVGTWHTITRGWSKSSGENVSESTDTILGPTGDTSQPASASFTFGTPRRTFPAGAK